MQLKYLIWLFIFIQLPVQAEQSPKLKSSISVLPIPLTEAVEPTEAERELLLEGKHLHDSNELDKAIKIYEVLLEKNPKLAVAWYELSYSLMLKKEYKKSLDAGMKGAVFKSPVLPQLYEIIGSDYDMMNDPTTAIDVYTRGIERAPEYGLLHFNLAITYSKIGKLDEARNHFKQSLLLSPAHLTSHFAIAQMFLKEGYKVPALLAASRYLVLDPKSQQADYVLRMVNQILTGSVKEEGPKKTTIMFDPDGKKDEGDFGSVDLAISIATAAHLTEENKGKSPIEFKVKDFEMIFELLGNTAAEDKPKEFVWAFYVPYFGAMEKAGHVEAFCYYIHQAQGVEEVKKWLYENREKVAAFRRWSDEWKWKKP